MRIVEGCEGDGLGMDKDGCRIRGNLFGRNGLDHLR